MERLPNRYPKISQSHKVPLYKGLSLFYPKLQKYSVLSMSLTRIWMVSWRKTYVYPTRMVMGNATEIVKEGFPKVRWWQFLYAIISVPIAILRSIIRIVSAAASTKSSPHAVSYNRFVELTPHVFCKMMLFMKLYVFGKCTGITWMTGKQSVECIYKGALWKGLCWQRIY